MRSSSYDVAVIGAGIVGASIAAELSKESTVLLLEMEDQPGYHATGRSAAVFAPTYGPETIRALTRASEGFFRNPPDGFTEYPLLAPRSTLFVARQDQASELQELVADVGKEAVLELLDAKSVREVQPLLREGYAAGGILDRNCSDIDVHGLHHGYLRQFNSLGGTLAAGAEVQRISRSKGLWSLTCAVGTFRAPIVVNAAGAWAEQIGQLAGAEPIGLVPKRRTALTIQSTSSTGVDDLPLTVDISEEFYLKPDAGRLLVSPANEDPDMPTDAQPTELDIAICIHRIEQAFDLKIDRIESRWAGLRSFVSDKVPVAGFSERVEGFYWLAGQGGYGIQSAPALALYAAASIMELTQPAVLSEEGFDPASLAVERFCEPEPVARAT